MTDFTRSFEIVIDASVHDVFEYCRDPRQDSALETDGQLRRRPVAYSTQAPGMPSPHASSAAWRVAQASAGKRRPCRTWSASTAAATVPSGYIASYLKLRRLHGHRACRRVARSAFGSAGSVTRQ